MFKRGYLGGRGRFWDPKTPHIIRIKGGRSWEGGVDYGGSSRGMLVSGQLKTDIHPLTSFKTFEAISARIGNNSFSGFVVCLYRLQNGTC